MLFTTNLREDLKSVLALDLVFLTTRYIISRSAIYMPERPCTEKKHKAISVACKCRVTIYCISEPGRLITRPIRLSRAGPGGDVILKGCSGERLHSHAVRIDFHCAFVASARPSAQMVLYAALICIVSFTMALEGGSRSYINLVVINLIFFFLLCPYRPLFFIGLSSVRVEDFFLTLFFT